MKIFIKIIKIIGVIVATIIELLLCSAFVYYRYPDASRSWVVTCITAPANSRICDSGFPPMRIPIIIIMALNLVWIIAIVVKKTKKNDFTTTFLFDDMKVELDRKASKKS